MSWISGNDPLKFMFWMARISQSPVDFWVLLVHKEVGSSLYSPLLNPPLSKKRQDVFNQPSLEIPLIDWYIYLSSPFQIPIGLRWNSWNYMYKKDDDSRILDQSMFHTAIYMYCKSLFCKIEPEHYVGYRQV